MPSRDVNHFKLRVLKSHLRLQMLCFLSVIQSNLKQMQVIKIRALDTDELVQQQCKEKSHGRASLYWVMLHEIYLLFYH